MPPPPAAELPPPEKMSEKRFYRDQNLVVNPHEIHWRVIAELSNQQKVPTICRSGLFFVHFWKKNSRPEQLNVLAFGQKLNFLKKLKVMRPNPKPGGIEF